jgi:hypothetical protein
MRRKTAPKDPVHPEVSRAVASEVGLIAKAEEGAQSAVGEYVLDNLSHRTTQGSVVRGRRARLDKREPCSARPNGSSVGGIPANSTWSRATRNRSDSDNTRALRRSRSVIACAHPHARRAPPWPCAEMCPTRWDLRDYICLHTSAGPTFCAKTSPRWIRRCSAASTAPPS